MSCPELPRVQPFVDGELGAAEEDELARHVAGCAECRAAVDEAHQVAHALRRRVTRYRAGPALAARIGAALDAAPVGTAAPAGRAGRARWLRLPEFWGGAVGGALAAGLAALVLTVGPGRGAPDPIEHDVVTAHLRALASDHAIDVVSSDRHTVKPWFAGHADVAPPVTDFAAEGFVLAGGRVDYVDGTRAAVVVYRHGAHLIDVFAWRDAAAPVRERATSANGYRLLFWRAGDLAFCAVSDTAEPELATLRRLIGATLPPDVRE